MNSLLYNPEFHITPQNLTTEPYYERSSVHVLYPCLLTLRYFLILYSYLTPYLSLLWPIMHSNCVQRWLQWATGEVCEIVSSINKTKMVMQIAMYNYISLMLSSSLVSSQYRIHFETACSLGDCHTNHLQSWSRRLSSHVGWTQHDKCLGTAECRWHSPGCSGSDHHLQGHSWSSWYYRWGLCDTAGIQ